VLNRKSIPALIALFISPVLFLPGNLLKASITLTAPQAQGNLLLPPQAKPGPHFPE
jgi:hypothetical protein